MRARPRAGFRAVVALLALCIAATAGTGAYVAATGVRAASGSAWTLGDRSRGGATAAPAPLRADSRARVAPLGRLVPPTLMAVAQQPISKRTLKRITHLDEVQEVTTFDAGRVRMAGRRINMFGVDPSTFRSWTPPSTASSDGLWARLAHGDLVLSSAARKALDVQRGHPYVVSGRQTRQLRLGATAALGLPALDAVVNEEASKALGLVPDLGVLVNAPGADLDKLERSLRKVLGERAQVLRLRQQLPTGTSTPPGGSSASRQSATPDQSGASAPGGRPRTYKQLYMQAARRCPGLSWTVLAAIGQVESGHGRNLGPSSAGALGPMQFMPSTWSRYGLDADGDGSANIMSPYDAVPSAANYLCAHGAGDAPGELSDAVFAYNHAWWYVREVLSLAQRYAAA